MPSVARMRSLVFAGLCLGAVALGPLAARADEAEQIRSDIVAGLDEMLASPDNAVTYSGVDVKGSAAPYDVTIHGIVFAPPKGKADIGDVSFKLAPKDDGTYEVSDVKLPSSVSVVDETGAPDGSLTIGSQSFKGVWSKALQTFLSMDGSFGDIKAVDGTGKEVFSVGGATLQGDSKETTPSHWDQNATFKISDVKAGDETTKVTIGEIELGSQIRALDMAALETLKTQIEAITEEAAKAQATMPPDDGTGTQPPQDDSGAAQPPSEDNGGGTTEQPSNENKTPDQPQGGDQAQGGDQGQADQGQADQGQADQGQADQGQTDQGQSDQSGQGQADNGSTGSSDTGTGSSDTGTENGPQADSSGSTEGPSPAEAEAAQKMLQTLRDLPTVLGDAISHIAVRGLVVQDGDGKEVFNLGDGGIDLGLTGLDQEKSGFRFAYHHLGLKGDWAKLNQAESESGEPMDAQSQQLVDALAPSDLVIDIRLEDLPGKELWQGFLETVGTQAMSGGPGGPDLESAGALFGMSAVGTLQKAGAKIRLVDSRIVSKTASIALEGELKADPAAPMGGTGSLKIEIVGLDDLIQVVKTNMTGPDAAEETAPLELLRAFADRTTASDGKTVDRYVMTLDPSGGLLLNGKDFQFLMNAMGGQGPGASPDQPTEEPAQPGQDEQPQQPGEDQNNGQQ